MLDWKALFVEDLAFAGSSVEPFRVSLGLPLPPPRVFWEENIWFQWFRRRLCL
jgi:hypothetical protein